MTRGGARGAPAGAERAALAPPGVARTVLGAARAPLVHSLAWALALVAAAAAQRATGMRELTPGLLHPDVLAAMPKFGRPVTGVRLDLHASVPLAVELIPGKRPDLFQVVGRPGRLDRKLVVPGLLNLEFDYGKKLRRAHRFEVQSADGVLSLFSHSGTVLELERHAVAFVDLDHDGAFGGPGDGWVHRPPGERRWLDATGSVAIRSMREPLAIDGEKVWFEVAPEGFFAIVSTTEPDFSVERNSDYRAALAWLDELRARLGLAPVALDAELSVACELHAIYCDLNGELTHDEQTGAPGYTKEGALAGRASVVMNSTVMKRAVQFWLDTFYHRIHMLSPRLQRVGMGLVHGVAVMDVQSGQQHRGGKDFEPYAWPYDGQADVPVAWPGGEWPSPIGVEPFSADVARSYGYPITLTFPTASVQDVSVRLSCGERELPVWSSTPEHPGNRAFPDNMDTVFLMCERPLEPGALHTVRVRCTVAGKPFEKEWSFTTR